MLKIGLRYRTYTIRHSTYELTPHSDHCTEYFWVEFSDKSDGAHTAAGLGFSRLAASPGGNARTKSGCPGATTFSPCAPLQNIKDE